jgi:nitrate/nitrite transporter NarK
MSKTTTIVRGNSKYGLIAGTTAFFGGFAAVALYGITVNALGTILHLSVLEVGWLVSIPLITGAFLRIPFSALVDRWGGKRVLSLQLFISIVGMIGIIFTLESTKLFPSLFVYELLLLFGALAGTGISTFSSGVTYVSYWYPKSKQGTALGIYGGFGNTAPGIFTAIIPYALSTLGLIGAYISWLAFLIIVTAVFLFISSDNYYQQLLRKGYSRDEAERIARGLGQEVFPTNVKETLKSASKLWQVWLLVIMYFISFGGFVALTSWLPTYWTKFIGVSITEAGMLAGVIYSLLTALIRVPGGIWSDKYGGEKIAFISFIILVLGSLVMFSSRSLDLSIIGEVIMAIGMGIANAAVFKLIPKYAPNAVGGASGLVGGLGAAGGLFIPPVLAYFVVIFGKIGFAYGFITYTIFGMISVIFSVFLLHRYSAYRHSISK